MITMKYFAYVEFLCPFLSSTQTSALSRNQIDKYQTE